MQTQVAAGPREDDAEPPAGVILLPSRDVFAAHHNAALIDSALNDTASTQVLEALCSVARSPYAQEALLHRFMSRAIPVGSRVSSIGIPTDHPLFTLREMLVERAEKTGVVDEVSRLVIWGASATSGPTLYREAGLLGRSYVRGILDSRPDLFGGKGILSLIKDWAEFSGVRHPKAWKALDRALRDQALNLHAPSYEASFSKLDHSMLQLAEQLAAGDRRLAYFIFASLCRLRAYQLTDGTVRWRSMWLRGAGRDDLGIRGASAYQKELPRILHREVLTKIRPHLAGKRSATYKLRFELRPGLVGPKEAAQFFGIPMNEDGHPRRM